MGTKGRKWKEEKTEGVFTTEKGLCLNFAISQKLESRGLFIKRSVVCVLREGKASREFGKTLYPGYRGRFVIRAPFSLSRLVVGLGKWT